MMHLGANGTLRGEFRLRATAALRRRLREQHRQKERRERREDIENEADEFADMVATLATSIEIVEFEAELDIYDTATVAALQENDRQLDLARERLDDLLAQAFVLPDGRRVFKTADGLSVFDEHGQEVDASIVDPDTIPDNHPRWEAYQSARDRVVTLTAERTQLLDFQVKLDEARERLATGDITREEFDKLRQEIHDSMPDAVREQISDAESKVDLEKQAAPNTETGLEISSEMVPSAMEPTI